MNIYLRCLHYYILYFYQPTKADFIVLYSGQIMIRLPLVYFLNLQALTYYTHWQWRGSLLTQLCAFFPPYYTLIWYPLNYWKYYIFDNFVPQKLCIIYNWSYIEIYLGSFYTRDSMFFLCILLLFCNMKDCCLCYSIPKQFL